MQSERKYYAQLGGKNRTFHQKSGSCLRFGCVFFILLEFCEGREIKIGEFFVTIDGLFNFTRYGKGSHSKIMRILFKMKLYRC